MGDLGKLIVAKGFKKLPKVQKIARSGHTVCEPHDANPFCYNCAGCLQLTLPIDTGIGFDEYGVIFAHQLLGLVQNRMWIWNLILSNHEQNGLTIVPTDFL